MQLDPHDSGVNETFYRVTQVADEYCGENTHFCEDAEGLGDWNKYIEPFNIGNESCHLIEYYSVDNVDKIEKINKQCVFVDNTHPEVDKEIGDPKVEEL